MALRGLWPPPWKPGTVEEHSWVSDFLVLAYQLRSGLFRDATAARTWTALSMHPASPAEEHSSIEDGILTSILGWDSALYR